MNKILLFLFIFVFPLFGYSETASFRIGRDPFWAPFNLNSETYNVTAFTAALLKEVSQIENIELDLIDANSFNLYSGLCQGKFDAILSAHPAEGPAAERYDFSSPFILLGPVLVVREEATEKTLNAMKGKNVGVYAYDGSVLIAQKVPTLLIQLYENMPLALEDLAMGKLDGVLISSLKAHALIPHLYQGVLRIATPPLNDDAIRLLTLKGKGKNLHSVFNRGIKKLKKKGLYKILRLEYGVN